ncbi:MAG TPA: ribonuclease J, partial [Candidatus Doudnabacteria bacterium]|nr:ribonuclease J [Candidatus Doudnabacteria bacterium]
MVKKTGSEGNSRRASQSRGSARPTSRPSRPNASNSDKPSISAGRTHSNNGSRPRSGGRKFPIMPTESKITPLDRVASGSNSVYTVSRDTLRIIPLGGLEEVGANMMAYEFGDDIIIVDAGFAFPDETTPGIDYIIPETKYLEDKKDNIRGLFVTHGHMDHIGAIPYLLAKLGDPPIYTLQLSAGMIKKRLEEFNLAERAKINVVGRDDMVPLGNFQVRFFAVNHNIPDSVGLSIKTPIGQVIHTGDWKFDHTPVNEVQTEFHKIASFGGEGVLALMSDSTNAIKPGYSQSEREIGRTMDRIFQDAKGRIVFTSFSSLIARIQQVFDLSAKYNRKVIV